MIRGGTWSEPTEEVAISRCNSSKRDIVCEEVRVDCISDAEGSSWEQLSNEELRKTAREQGQDLLMG